MAYTASACSFLLENLAKCVIFTGSQIPLSEIRNDGYDIFSTTTPSILISLFISRRYNLIGAVMIAGNFEIPEVCLFFNNQLFRGNRYVYVYVSIYLSIYVSIFLDISNDSPPSYFVHCFLFLSFEYVSFIQMQEDGYLGVASL